MTTEADRGADAITCEGLSLTRGRWTRVLDNITLRVPEGAVVGLVGRNGAGKTSLIQCLVGLTVPDMGNCRLLGEDAQHLSDAARNRLGYVAQTPDLFDWLSGEAHLERFSALYDGWSQRRAIELAALLDLSLGALAKNLSGGDQQKLSVVLALAHDPDLLILDEPVASLDPLTRRDFMRSLFERRHPNQRPRTVLISSHLLADLERVVTHVAFMREGQLQLFDERDALTEYLRVLELPADSAALPLRVLNRRAVGDRVRVVFDSRIADAPPAAGQAMSLDQLFDELNRT